MPRHYRRWPIRLGVTILIVLILLVAAALVVHAVQDTVSGGSGAISLSATQTRQAIDANLPALPQLINVVSGGFETSANLPGNVSVNQSFVPPLGAKKATGSEFISTPQVLPADVLNGYYEGRYSAYKASQLQEYFNGAYELDWCKDSKGALYQLSYVNLKSADVAGELNYLISKQGLIGYKAKTSASGTDSGGYLCQRGTIHIGSHKFYYEVQATDFSRIYRAQNLTTPAVYAVFSMADYNFYKKSSKLQ
ncbi:MAG: hypothetical protein LBL67_03580 [Coriobacteriales bacterium]|nr:hypothetical protein [Coriobacteriales bacterium]